MRNGKKFVKTTLPYEIIIEILSRSPAKSLFRFKNVCKRWKATISNPKFHETHVLQSKNSPSSYLAPPREIHSDVFTRIELRGNDLQQLSAMGDQPMKLGLSTVWCHCDGLILLSHDHKEYLLWNPSTGTCRKLRCPRHIATHPLIGICYDPLLMDYKLVVRDKHQYAVYFCKTDSWIVREEMANSDTFDINVIYHNGVPFNGSIYWINSPGKYCGDEILCFDRRDHEFKILPRIDGLEGVNNWVNLISGADGGLYLFPYYKPCPLTNELLFMKKVEEESWMKMKLQRLRLGEYSTLLGS